MEAKHMKMEHERSANGGHVFTHHFMGPEYSKPEVHTFSADEGDKAMDHFAKHAGIKMVGKLTSAAAAAIRSKAGKSMMLVLFMLGLCGVAHAAPSTFQVTIGASATQISATHLYCSAWIIQNNAAHNIRFGDSTVTSSKGTVLASGSPGGSYTTTASMNGTQPAPDDLSQWYIAGTQNDVIDVTCKTVNF